MSAAAVLSALLIAAFHPPDGALTWAGSESAALVDLLNGSTLPQPDAGFRISGTGIDVRLPPRESRLNQLLTAGLTAEPVRSADGEWVTATVEYSGVRSESSLSVLIACEGDSAPVEFFLGTLREGRGLLGSEATTIPARCSDPRWVGLRVYRPGYSEGETMAFEIREVRLHVASAPDPPAGERPLSQRSFGWRWWGHNLPALRSYLGPHQ